MLYFIVRNFWLIWLRVSQGIRMYDRGNIPKKGAFLFIANHLSSNDPFVLVAGTRRHLAFMGKDSLFRHPVANLIMRGLGGYPINRDADPRDVLYKTVEILRSGKPTTMFPEGSRNKVDESLREFKKGAALVAIRAGVPVLPAAILGTNHKEGKISVIFGSLMDPPTYSKENIRLFNQQMQDAVEALLEEFKKKHYDS